jgi:cysteine-rich repeat protein
MPPEDLMPVRAVRLFVAVFVALALEATAPAQVASCGNGTVDPGEECDDANAIDCDGCSALCRTEACGNGVLECGEGCDDGNTAPGDGCDASCRVEPPPTCGDGTTDPPEECDDGNTVDCDGCSALCRIEACGDGVRQCGEECDDANAIDCDGCSALCRTEACGNGVLECGEGCDDGNTAPGDGCGSSCRPEALCSDADGDGVPDAVDRCVTTSPGQPVDDGGCSIAEFCGAFDATTRDGARVCRRADWRNDEPLMGPRDRDCTVAGGAAGRGDDTCVPTG